MDRAFESGAVASPPSPPVAVSLGFPMGIGAYPYENTTKVGEWWFHMATEEIRNVILMGNIVPSHLAVNQMAMAIQNAIAASASTKSAVGHVHATTDITNLQPTLTGLRADLTAHTHSYLINGGGTAVLDASGNLTTTGNVTGFSDARLKTDVKVIEDAVAKVNKIRGVTFLRKDLPQAGRMIGVIAQEVQAVQPELVQEDSEGRLSVAYGNMVGLLVEAIKELSAEIELLKEERGK